MKIHEYQARELFVQYGIPCPNGYLALNAAEALSAAKRLGNYPVVVKAQIHSGGRGKAGGVKLCHNDEEVLEFASKLIGSRLYTKQTGPEGKEVQRLVITEGAHIAREYYLSMTVDSANACVVMIASAEGGTEIEDLSKDHPEKILQHRIDPARGYKDFDGWEVARKLGLSGD
ncbi:MAG: acetate--CoA ligase family protein, partial [Clostridia bacterium]|nr:acetate--CoA ligase family protein [Clostridia bacterium]